jgi:NAD(P) transhydrogenase subunit alpha
MEIYLLLFFILILAIFLGLELISKIPSTLHTPLMSVANAISGITLVGALTLQTDGTLQMVLAFCAIAFASINVFGGYLVTNRMLKMFKKK